MSILPPLYHAWSPGFLPGDIPPENKAPCSNCVMCQPGASGPAQLEFFNPVTKCCTYLPQLPNFLTGRVLLDDSLPAAFGRDTVEQRIRRQTGVTPLGLGSTPEFREKYNGKSFGQDASLRCPHYQPEGGQCGIWQHRNAICSTWFCKHERGAVGLDFWKALEQLLGAAEQALVKWCLLRLDLGVTALKTMFPPAWPQSDPGPAAVPQKIPPPAAASDLYRQVWGNWVGREPEFYRECARLVDVLTWPEVVKIAGPEIGLYTVLVDDAYTQLTRPQLPVRLWAAPYRSAGPAGDGRNVLVKSYSSYDALRLSEKLAGLLEYFQGQPLEETLQRIKDEKNVTLSPGLLQKLADFKLLVPAE